MSRLRLVDPPGRQGPGPTPASAVAALDLAIARRTAGRLPGEHISSGVGLGTELAQIRPYVIGDDLRQIDPAASARTNELHVRLQVPERALTTWVLLDVSPSMAFGTADRLKSDVAAGWGWGCGVGVGRDWQPAATSAAPSARPMLAKRERYEDRMVALLSR